jgi:putative glycosyltransferase
MLSIVATLYRSAPYIKEFYSRASSVAMELASDDYEIILVDDGSPDNSLELAVSLTESDNKVTIIELSRNFGHHKAMMTGLMYAKGQKIFLIDCDLEEEPEWLLVFNRIMTHSSCDVVFGVQISRKGKWLERQLGHLFYWIYNYLVDTEINPNQTVARLMSSQYVRAILQYNEREFFIGGVMAHVGYNQVPCKVIKGSTSPSTYTLRKRVSQAIDGILSFSSKPLTLISLIGLMISISAFFLVLFVAFSWLAGNTAPIGWTSLVASIWLSTGLLMVSSGVIGAYIAKVFSESKERPRTVVRSVFTRKPNVDSEESDR